MKYRFLSFLVLLTSIAFAQPQTPFSSLDVFELEWVSNPQISPDGNWVVYERKGMDIMKDRRQSRLWLIKADGTDNQKMTLTDVNESQATWSSDGEKVAYVSSTGQGAEIFVYWVKTGPVNLL